jgi:hypothetical protein
MRKPQRIIALALGALILGMPTSGVAAPLFLPSLRTSTLPRLDGLTSPQGSSPVTIVAAGDIACDPSNSAFNRGRGSGSYCRASAVDKVIRAIDPYAVLALGDEQYDHGRLRAFRNSYDRSWGHERARTLPVPGNHEYEGTSNAHGYFQYFGRHAGPNPHGWYSVTKGSWRLIALNSNCFDVGCAPGSTQYVWLRHLLMTHPSACTLAFMHHPLISSGPHGDDEAHARPLWKLLFRHGVDVALVGHDHIYERFAPVDPSGTKNKRYGIREFIVGTGGAMHYGITGVHRYSQVHNTNAFGVLQLTLRSGAYDWRFRPAAGATFSDHGSARCHGAP